MRPRNLLLVLTALSAFTARGIAVEIPLESITPVRIGFIDLQKVFDTYPEKAFAEGDLLKEIQKRRTEMSARQTLINALRSQVASDQEALDQAKAGKAVVVPRDEVTPLQPSATPAAPPTPEPVVKPSTSAAAEPYPTEEPLAGLPGHGGDSGEKKLPGMNAPEPAKPGSSELLDNLAATATATQLNPEAQAALQKRIQGNKLTLDRTVYQFKDYRGKALEDMKQLQTQKTYGVMAKIYAILQSLARDEGITVVLDKAYVLYGEETIDLTDRLVERLNTEQVQ
jgi:Skp family chaperone for outer membrane proteins